MLRLSSARWSSKPHPFESSLAARDVNVESDVRSTPPTGVEVLSLSLRQPDGAARAATRGDGGFTSVVEALGVPQGSLLLLLLPASVSEARELDLVAIPRGHVGRTLSGIRIDDGDKHTLTA